MATRLRGKLFGYDKKQVNTLLSDKSTQYEEALAARQERINALRDENRAMKDELAALKAREQSVVDALVTAQQQADQTIADAKREAEIYNHALVEENKLLHRRTLDMFDAIHDYYETQLMNLEKIRADVDRCVQRVQRHQEENQEARRAFIKQFLVVCDGPGQVAGVDSQPATAFSASLSAAMSASALGSLGAGDSSVTVLR